MILALSVPAAAQWVPFRTEIVEEEGVGRPAVALTFADHHTDVVLAELVERRPGGVRTIHMESLDYDDGAQQRPVWIEEYQVLDSALGKVSGRLLAVWVGHALADGTLAPMRPRQVGQRVVVAVSPAAGGVLQLGGTYNPSAEFHGVLLRSGDPRECVMSLSFEVESSRLLESEGTLSERLLGTALLSLAELSRDQQVRTLELLGATVPEDPVRLAAPDRLSRRLLGVMDDLDDHDRWLAYRALRRWGNDENLSEALESLRSACTDPGNWQVYPLRDADDYRWLQHPFEKRLGLLSSPQAVIDLADSACDPRLAVALVKHAAAERHPDLLRSGVARLWTKRSQAMELELLRILPFWSGLTNRRLERGEARGEGFVNRAELIDFWTSWLASDR
ncbi:MAG: hypothetical protein AB7F50_02835 [Fimbriimonadaceae bacterium]